jgi:hypothetical protein
MHGALCVLFFLLRIAIEVSLGECLFQLFNIFY